MKNSIRCFEGKAEPHEAFWKIRSEKETGGDPELEFYGVISEWSWLDDEITPKKFKNDLEQIGQGKPVTIRIDSPGGDPIAASMIASIISSYPGKVTAQIDGQASSAAVIVALAARHIRIMDTAYMMVHEPRVNLLMATLDRVTLMSMVEALTSINQGMIASYAARTGLSEKELEKMLAAETWMNAQEAVDKGFANEIVINAQKRPARKFEHVLRNFEHVPSALLNVAEESIEEPSEAGETPIVEPVSEPEQAEEHQAAPGGVEDEPAVDPLADQKLTLHSKRILQLKGATTMFVRELMKQRAALVSEAEVLVNQADSEGRDLTEEERTRFVAILGEGEATGEVGALDVKIEKIEAEREVLRAAAERQFSSPTPEKPAPSEKKIVSRAEFNQLSASDRAAFVKAGGKIQD